jgi:hypothetical protein
MEDERFRESSLSQAFGHLAHLEYRQNPHSVCCTVGIRSRSYVRHIGCGTIE